VVAPRFRRSVRAGGIPVPSTAARFRGRAPRRLEPRGASNPQPAGLVKSHDPELALWLDEKAELIEQRLPYHHGEARERLAGGAIVLRSLAEDVRAVAQAQSRPAAMLNQGQHSGRRAWATACGW
jgi:hypothetical protein